MEIFDHVIVGGGVIGASIAYHLASKGDGTVLLLERNELASAASSRAAGLILQASTKPSKTPLARLTVQTLPVLEDELNESVGFHDVGSLRVSTSDDRALELDAMVQDAMKWGIPVEFPSKAEIAGLIPWLDIGYSSKIAYFPTDGYVDPYLVSMAYIKSARARGAVVRPHTDVRDVILEGDKVVGVESNVGKIACGTVIDACGVWAALLSEQAGFPLPMAPVRSHYWITDPLDSCKGEHPITVLPDASAYTRPELGGLLIGVQEPHSATFNARDLPTDPAAFSPIRGEEHWEILADSYEGLSQFFPEIESAQFSNYISGLSAYTPDGEIVLGPLPNVTGFFTAAGDCGSGITLSAGIGDAMADLVLGRETAYDITRFTPDRFGEVDPFSESFRSRCATARASKSRKS